jgi:hypothetical protein
MKRKAEGAAGAVAAGEGAGEATSSAEDKGNQLFLERA